MRSCGRALIFGDQNTTAQYANNPAIQVHGPGFSKILIGEDESVTALGLEQDLRSLGHTVVGIAGDGASAVAMATPADGPSFGTAPAGKCTWNRRRMAFSPRPSCSRLDCT